MSFQKKLAALISGMSGMLGKRTCFARYFHAKA